MRRLIAVAVLSCLCLGQMCAAPSISEDNITGIAAGVYSGTVNYDLALFADGVEQASQNFDQEADAAMSADGLLQTAQDRNIAVGYSEDAQVGGLQTSSTITAVEQTAGQLVIRADALLNYTNNGGQVIPLAGTQVQTFVLRGDGNLDYSSILDVQNDQGEAVIRLTMTGSGVLR